MSSDDEQTNMTEHSSTQQPTPVPTNKQSHKAANVSFFYNKLFIFIFDSLFNL